MVNNEELVYTYIEKRDMKLFVGRIGYIDLSRQELRLIDLRGDVFYLKSKDILRVDFLE